MQKLFKNQYGRNEIYRDLANKYEIKADRFVNSKNTNTTFLYKNASFYIKFAKGNKRKSVFWWR